MSRAERRHRAEKAKARARRMLVEAWHSPHLDTPRHVGMFARTPKPCSCMMCGNPRAIEGPPMSERRKLAAKALRQRLDLVGTHGHQPPFG